MTSEPDGSTNAEPEVPEAPATWENVVMGEIKHVAGEVLRDEDLTEQGDEQKQAAHEVRGEWQDEHRD